MSTVEFAGLRHCETTGKATPARSILSLAEVATISRTSAGWALNLPARGQSLPMLGVSMRRFILASALIDWIFFSSSRESITYHSTPFDTAQAICSRDFTGFE